MATTSTTGRRTKRIVLVTAALMLFGGAAFAYWTGGGSGSGSVTSQSTLAALTVNQTSTISNLAPGVAAQTLSGNFNNPNAGKVYVTTVTVSISSVTKATGAVAGVCDATDYTLANASMTVGAEVPTGNAQGSWTGATIAFNDKTTNQDQCKGATVNLSYTAA